MASTVPKPTVALCMFAALIASVSACDKGKATQNGSNPTTTAGSTDKNASSSAGAKSSANMKTAADAENPETPRLRDGLTARLEQTNRLIVVQTSSWEAPAGQLTLYGRKDHGWEPLLGPVPANVGENGQGWGRGWTLPPEQPQTPAKVEGDGKATAGIFDVGKVHGYADTPPEGVSFPYGKVTEHSYCVYDVESEHYNQVFDWPADKPKAWKKAETMRRGDDLYSLLLTIRHNGMNGEETAIEPGAGSCIFLHVWRGNDQPTVGCTSIAKAKLVDVLTEIESPEKTLFVQFPAPVYYELAGNLDLPDARMSASMKE